jgi:DNA-binding transcriptional ArsR family regulator
MTTSPRLTHPIDDQLLELIARHFRVLGEPMRLKLLDALRSGEATVQELQQATGASQQNISKHLGVLHGAGLVSREKDGNYSRYAIADATVFDLCEQVCGNLLRHLDRREAVLRAAVSQPSGTF